MKRRFALSLFAISALVAAAAVAAESSQDTGRRAFLVPAKPSKNAPPGAARWQSSVRDAFAEAKSTSKPLLVDLTADWCAWCRVMDEQVFSTPRFAEFAKSYVLLRVDVEDGSEGSDLAARYNNESLPTLLLLEPKGALIGEIRGYQPVEDVEGMAKALHAAHERSLEAYEKLRTSTDVEALRPAAGDHYARRDSERAAVLFARLIELKPPTGEDEAWLRFLLADSLRGAGRYDEASAALESARPFVTDASDAELRERVALLPFWIARDAAHCADASGKLAEFERGHPESVFLPEARRALTELRGGRATCS